MMTAKNRKEHYLKNLEIRKNNSFIGVPLYKTFPRFGKFIPALPLAMQIMITAGSGVGKTQSWLGIVLLPTYKLIKEEGLKVKFLISLLEDTTDLFIDRLYSTVLYRYFNIKTDILTINSIRENPVSQDIVDKLDEAELIVQDILSYCEINDSIMNPTG